ncbi:MAG TPA: serine hydrolase domain-containing protein [Phycisphaerales bacterium]|nr:serine hydrolase domain-containing protein [Phycisphaerales bacterium]
MRWFLRLLVVAASGSVVWAQPAAAPPVAPPAPAVAVAADPAAATRSLLAAEFERQKLVGLSLVVVKNGRVLSEEHLGFADREAKTAAGPATMYRWASISKPVTAAAAMQLVEAGKLDLDADVRLLVPEFPEPTYTAAQKAATEGETPAGEQAPVRCTVTMRQLLCHQGGIVHYSNGKVVKLPPPDGVENPYADVVRALGTFKASPLVCEPGTKYAYTTHGYILASAVVERAGGRAFWAQVRERIATPAGMTSFRPDYQWETIEHRAAGYRKGAGAAAGTMVRSTDTDVSWKLGGGGFISTVGDLARFGSALMDGRLVKPETFSKMRAAQRLRNGDATTYGLGLGVGTLAGRETAAHSGSQEKAATYLLMVPDESLAVAVMCNTEGASLGKLAESVARAWMMPPAGGGGSAPVERK